MSDGPKPLSAREWIELVEDTIDDLAPHERVPFLRKLLTQTVEHFEFLLPTAATGAEKERLEMELRRMRASLAALERGGEPDLI